jgi:predicted DNA binding protein
MSDITATIRLKSSDLALTETIKNADTATVQPVPGTGTVPNLGAHLFTVQAEDFAQFEAALKKDHTITSFERISDLETEAVYRFEYGPEAKIFSKTISDVDGISLDWKNQGTAWIVRVWLPNRGALASLCQSAVDSDIDLSLERVRDYASLGGFKPDLTTSQRETLLLALEMGYFEEPRAVKLEDIAAELDISQPAAGGRIRRGIRQLLVSTIADDDNEVGQTEVE